MPDFARWIEHALDVTVQRSHHTDTSEHRWPVMFRDLQQNLRCGLPLFGIVLCLGQFGDVLRGVAEDEQRLPARQYDRIEKLLIP
jgi:hypothetical protein